MRISVVGTGYVGLVSGVCLAHVGHEVVCVDLDEDKVGQINAGKSPIHEDRLPELLTGVVGTRLRATSDLGEAVRSTEVTILAVGTPFGEERIDLGQIRSAAAQVGEALRDLDRYHVVVVKSTVVPGTTEEVVGPALEEASGRRVGADIGLAMNPEFLREGVAVDDFLTPDRIVLGGVDERTIDVLSELYAVFTDTPVLRTDPRTAEMVKYTSNALLATLISFSNEIGNLCGELGTDVVEVLEGVHLDRRFSPVVDGSRVMPGMLTYLAAGCGFGGSCFPKDVKALVAHGESVGAPMPLLHSVLDINQTQSEVMLDRLQRRLELSGARVAVLGAAFKPGTDDVRESPALRIVPALVAAGAHVVLHDPIALDPARAALGDVHIDYQNDLPAALTDVDAVLIVTAWPEYLEIPKLLGDRAVLVLDGRRMLAKDSVLEYDGVGYPTR